MSRNRAIAAAVVMVLATPIVAFWLIPGLSEAGEPDNLDYMVRLDVSADTIRVLGILALVAWVLAGVGILTRYWTDPPPDATRLVVSLMVAGVVVAGVGRVVTAGVIGANIGGGMAMMAGGPIVVGIVAYGITPFLPLGRRRPPGPPHDGGQRW